MEEHERAEWRLPGAAKDRQTVTARWRRASGNFIDGVSVHEVQNIPKSGGYLTEILRSEWVPGREMVDQIFQTVLDPGAVSAWHCHEHTTDRLFVSQGTIRIVLYDRRDGSPTHGKIDEMIFGTERPALVVVPPRIWHGVQNVSESASILLNVVDAAYAYEDPDHWRVPADSADIPFRFAEAGAPVSATSSANAA